LRHKENFFPLRVNFCSNCFHLQLSHSISPDLMFKNYLYVSGTSGATIKHFKDYALNISKKFNNKKIKVLDIASNDGTFLKCFVGKKFKKLGIDPAKNLVKIAKSNGIKQLAIYFNYKNSKKIKSKYGNFDIVTANNVCAHVDKFQNFVQGVKNILSSKGIFSFEVSYLVDVITKKTFDTIYHEHVDYHSLMPLINFFKKLDLEIIDATRVKAQGGSIRVFVSHRGARKINISKINKLISIEKNRLKLFKIATYKSFQKKIDTHKKKLNKLLKNLKKNNQIIAGFGAPAKTTTLLNYFKIGSETIDFIVDDNELKQNRFTPGTHIPIYNNQVIYERKPDYVIILAWNFVKPIIVNHKNYLKLGGSFIVPFPELQIIKKL